LFLHILSSYCRSLGPAIYIYGNTGPTYGSYQVEIDSEVLQYSAYRESASNASTPLFAASNLTYANHNLVLRNLGARPDVGDKGGDAFLLDYIQSTIQLAPTGWGFIVMFLCYYIHEKEKPLRATVKNVTYEENDPALTFSGTWGKNTGPLFSGGGTTYTNQDQASFTFSFQGAGTSSKHLESLVDFLIHAYRIGNLCPGRQEKQPPHLQCRSRCATRGILQRYFGLWRRFRFVL